MATKKKTVTPPPQSAKKDCSLQWAWAVVGFAVLFSAIIRIRLLQFPLERDEGEFAYAGQLILQGIPPYKYAYNMKLPGTYAAYALIMAIFGQTIGGIHLGVLLVNAAAVVLVFLIGKRLFDPYTGAVAAATYSLLALGQMTLGLAGHATHFVILPALGATLLLLKAAETRRLALVFWSGLLFGLAFIMKQPGAVFIAFGGFYLLWTELRRKPLEWQGLSAQVGLYSLGAVIPFALTCLILYNAGVFDKFWFWTFSYAREYGTAQTIGDGIRDFKFMGKTVVGPAFPIWLLSGVGLLALSWDKKVRTNGAFVLSFLVFSFIAVSAGLYFRNHYWILVLPAVGLLAGIAVTSTGRVIAQLGGSRPAQFLPVLIFLTLFGWVVARESDFLFVLTPYQAARTTYGGNPFPESVEVGKYIRAHSKKDDRVAVLGSEPQIYFYAHRLSATGYIYTYGLMEEQRYARRMQQEMIDEIEQAAPRYLILVGVSVSWLPREKSERLVINWIPRYTAEHYELVGMVDLVSAERSEYYWGEEARSRLPQSRNYLLVYERNTPEG